MAGVIPMPEHRGRWLGDTENRPWNISPHDPEMRFRGPNLARQKDGTVLVNALLIFGVNSLDPTSKEEAIERGRRRFRIFWSLCGAVCGLR